MTEQSQITPNFQAEVRERLQIDAPEKLAKYLRLRKPGANYQRLLADPIWREDQGTTKETLADADPEKVELIKSTLMRVPLVHATREAFEGEIQPQSQIDSQTHSTCELDRSLGLDECTFYHWGPFRFPRYGDVAYLVDPQILNDPRTFVTPGDVVACVGADSAGETEAKIPYESLEDRAHESVSAEYLGRLVSGPEWIDITARRIAMTTGDAVMTQWGLQLGGEVKFFGAIPQDMITGRLDSEEQLMETAQEIKRDLEKASGTNIPYKELKKPPFIA